MEKKIIAIDGTAASGKGTLGKYLAKELDFAYLDTGKLYRYVGNQMLEAGLDPKNQAQAIKTAQEISITSKDLQNQALKSNEAGNAASKVAAIDGVRSALKEFQINFANNPPNNAKGTILDGRDIGTVICPNADFKFYVDADTEIRAKRRFDELSTKDSDIQYETILSDMIERDTRDSRRSSAPMEMAKDAIKIDTSEISIDEMFAIALDKINNKI